MSIVLVGSSSGSITLQEPAVAGTTTLNLPATSGTVVVTGTTPTLNGITFPATQSPSADANTLDDYEEGTWTPSVGGNATYTARYGIYTKIGNIVTCQFRLNVNAIGTGSSTALSGLPFTSANIGSASDVQTGCVSFWASLAVNTIYLSFYMENNATTLQFVGKATSGASVDNGIGLFGTNAIVYGSITYRVA
jgi:hypothetical protein